MIELPTCERCAVRFRPYVRGSAHQRYCSPQCQRIAWRRSERGQAVAERHRERRRARRASPESKALEAARRRMRKILESFGPASSPMRRLVVEILGRDPSPELLDGAEAAARATRRGRSAAARLFAPQMPQERREAA